ncbi:GAF and ANTAR domain-containing protein [Streptomyces buecherae]|uniref:GAF and ANTAR domain-containing protein n=1 Tax=Streptomyces buecherae TaxID=2763006 RepID=UPI00378909BA
MTADETEASRLVAEATAGVSPAELPRRLCTAVRAALGADGATLSLLTDTPARQLLGASDATALRLEEIQFTVLEGPCISAATTGEPVIVADLATTVGAWPLFGATMREQLPRVRAVHAFPLYFGDYVLGTVDVLAVRPRALEADAVKRALEVVDAVAVALMPARTRLFPGNSAPVWEPEEIVRAHWFDTRHAVGLVAEHRGVGPEDALALMRAEAFRTGRTLAEITADVLGRPPEPS